MLFYYQKQKLNMYAKTNKIEWNPSMAFIVAHDKIPIQHVWVAPLLFSFGKYLQHSWSKYNANQTGRKSLGTSLIADFMNFSYWRDICSIKKNGLLLQGHLSQYQEFNLEGMKVSVPCNN